MRNPRLRSQLDSLKSLLQHTSVATANDSIDLLLHWGSYLCVLTAGFLENSIEEVYGEFVRDASSQPVARFAEYELG